MNNFKRKLDLPKSTFANEKDKIALFLNIFINSLFFICLEVNNIFQFKILLTKLFESKLASISHSILLNKLNFVVIKWYSHVISSKMSFCFVYNVWLHVANQSNQIRDFRVSFPPGWRSEFVNEEVRKLSTFGKQQLTSNLIKIFSGIFENLCCSHSWLQNFFRHFTFYWSFHWNLVLVIVTYLIQTQITTSKFYLLILLIPWKF